MRVSDELSGCATDTRFNLSLRTGPRVQPNDGIAKGKTMSDEYEGFTHGLEAPAKDGFEIVPNDGVDLPRVTRAVHVGTGGAVRVTLLHGATVTLTGLSNGALLPIRALRVHATGTTAGGLVALL